VPLFSSI